MTSPGVERLWSDSHIHRPGRKGSLTCRHGPAPHCGRGAVPSCPACRYQTASPCPSPTVGPGRHLCPWAVSRGPPTLRLRSADTHTCRCWGAHGFPRQVGVSTAREIRVLCADTREHQLCSGTSHWGSHREKGREGPVPRHFRQGQYLNVRCR